jgi:hypothetical protein
VCAEAMSEMQGEEDPVLTDLRVMVRKSQDFEKTLSTYEWSVLDAPSRKLLIGDAPVIALDGKAGGWTGLLPAGAVVFLPLSPSKLMMGEPKSIEDPGNVDRLVETVNALTTEQAFSDVFRHPDTQWPKGLASAPMSHLCQPRPSLAAEHRQTLRIRFPTHTLT